VKKNQLMGASIGNQSVSDLASTKAKKFGKAGGKHAMVLDAGEDFASIDDGASDISKQQLLNRRT